MPIGQIETKDYDPNLKTLQIHNSKNEEIFSITCSGEIKANWHELMRLKDEFLSSTSPTQAQAVAAALWLVKNT